MNRTPAQSVCKHCGLAIELVVITDFSTGWTHKATYNDYCELQKAEPKNV